MHQTLLDLVECLKASFLAHHPNGTITCVDEEHDTQNRPIRVRVVAQHAATPNEIILAIDDNDVTACLAGPLWPKGKPDAFWRASINGTSDLVGTLLA